MRRKYTALSLLTLTAIAATVIGIWIAGGTLPTPTPTQQSPSIGQEAPDFALEDLSGKPIKLSNFRGKVVLIDFMATWCGPCRTEMTHLGDVWEKYDGRIVLISIDVDVRESREQLNTYIKDFPYATWTWTRDTVNASQTYGVSAIPTIVIVDKEGRIAFRHVGVTDSSTLFNEIDQLLGG